MDLFDSKFLGKSISGFLLLGLSFCTTSTYALTDIYFVTGEDLDFLVESDKTYAVEEIQYELRKIPFFSEVEDFVFNLQDEYLPEGD